MVKQVVFLIVLLITLGVFTFSIQRYFRYFKFTKKKPLGRLWTRLWKTIKIAGFQTKILRRPWIGLVHASVFWGFMIIIFGSIEMVFDGLLGTEKIFGFLGWFYSFLMGSGDIFALIIAIAMIIFIARRVIFHVKRFSGVEMKPVSEYDALLALAIIFFLMISLMGMNTFYFLWAKETGEPMVGVYPIAQHLWAPLFANVTPEQAWFWYQFNWWFHIVLIFIFANILPYSKHFHVFLSIPDVFISRLVPFGYIENMPNITKEVKMMLDPNATFEEPEEEGEPERFGALDVDDLEWTSYFNSLACTECGRCTSVCPANITGKLLSPRKVMMNTRARMKEKGPGLLKEGKAYDDGKHLVFDYLTEEELWACTMCNACAQECPVEINQPSIILEARRYLVMEESKAPS
ncbi:Iron-sulphur-binding reductase, partial [hydrothermal vent metagenome]